MDYHQVNFKLFFDKANHTPFAFSQLSVKSGAILIPKSVYRVRSASSANVCNSLSLSKPCHLLILSRSFTLDQNCLEENTLATENILVVALKKYTTKVSLVYYFSKLLSISVSFLVKNLTLWDREGCKRHYLKLL